MNSEKVQGLGMAILMFLVGGIFPGKSAATSPQNIDDDWPYSASTNLTYTASGNPLDDGDITAGLRWTYRFFSGYGGFETALEYARPSTDLVPGNPEDVELLMLDFSFLWYLNYDQQKSNWQSGAKIKPEFFLFGGPGFASLRLKDVVPGPQFQDAVDDFFTVNFGAGVNIYWYRTDLEENCYRCTSNWFLRPEVRARWFAGDENTVDWGVGLSIGYSFGERSTYGALELKVEEACRQVAEIPAAGQRLKSMTPEEYDKEYQQTLEGRQRLQNLEAQVMACGSKCAELRECLMESIEGMNRRLSNLRPNLGEAPI